MRLPEQHLPRGPVSSLPHPLLVQRLNCGKTGGLQLGGGITDKNALEWLNAGADKAS